MRSSIGRKDIGASRVKVHVLSRVLGVLTSTVCTQSARIFAQRKRSLRYTYYYSPHLLCKIPHASICQDIHMACNKAGFTSFDITHKLKDNSKTGINAV